MPKIALPNKGRLSEGVRSVLEDAGLEVRVSSERALVAPLGDPSEGNGWEALFVRAQDVPELVADGAVDAGVTGWDCALESGRALRSLVDLGFGRCRLAVACRAGGSSALEAVEDGARIATSFPRLTAAFFRDRGREVTIVPLGGAVEVAPHVGIADVVVDLVSTGSTLRTNGLVEIATILESSARLVARPRDGIDARTAAAVDDLALALASVVRARGQRYLMANAPRASLAAVRDVLPGISGPTVIELGGADRGLVAVHAVVPQPRVRRTVARLKALGCEGILVTRIERLVP